MKRTIEMDDNLDEIVADAKSELEERFAELKDADEPHDLISEIADSFVPVYTKEIEDLYYLHGDMLDDAYEDAGIGDGKKEDNYKQVAIYCYIEQELWDFYNEELSVKEDE